MGILERRQPSVCRSPSTGTIGKWLAVPVTPPQFVRPLLVPGYAVVSAGLALSHDALSELSKRKGKGCGGEEKGEGCEDF